MELQFDEMSGTFLNYLMNSDAMTVIIGEVLTSISESHGITWVVVPFGILERISICSYVFATVGTVERPFPAKTYHYLLPNP